MKCSAILASLLLPAIASATDHIVVPGGSIQLAIDAAAPGDRVLIQPGTYNETIDLKGKAIEVLGVAGADHTQLVAEASQPAIKMWSGETAATRVAGLRVIGGFHWLSYGGGISGTIDGTQRATARIEDCVIQQCTASAGGGIAGDFEIVRCSIAQNNALGHPSFGPLSAGGAVWGNATLRGCRVWGNDTFGGPCGGLYVPDGSRPVVVEDTVFYLNFDAFEPGGTGVGIYLDGAAQATIERTLIVGCAGTGGLIELQEGVAVHAEPTASATMTRCTVVQNSSSFHVGDVGGVWGPITLVNSVVRSNTSKELGGGAVATFCNIEGGAPGVGNIDAEPLFVEYPIGDLDYHLTPESPCVDAGDPALLDADGTRSDIGAYELQSLYVDRDFLLLSPLTKLAPAWEAVPAEIGGVHPLRIYLGPAHAGELYLVLGSISGTAPGTPFGGALLPLNPDTWFAFTLADPNGAVTEATLGVLDAAGRAEAQLQFPSFPLGLPATAWHAAVTFDLQALAVTAVTNAVPLELLP
ncbi:MAG: right-handed parallel beta-helix repeat-containing protein [Planctomycetota bacterium]